MKKRFFLLLMAACMANMLSAQLMTAEEYIAQYKDIAISEMRRTGVPAAITLAQGLHESENGNSDLVKESNNHFGIKCKSNWTAQTVSHDDDKPGECFRAYKTAEDSYRDHSDFLRSSSRYAFLFKLNPRDYKGWAKGLYRAGYATNPRYADILIKSIEQYNLEQYTLDAMNDSADNNVQYASEQQEHNDDAINNNDAASVITINGCKAIWAAKGTSLLAIATQNNINLSRLLDMNDLQQDGLLDKDQYIFLEKKQKQGDKDYYIVQQEETLYDVAQKNGIVLQNITDYNTGITSANHLYPGTKIWLRPHDLSTPSDGATNAGNDMHEKKEVVFHTVQQRESLYTISKHYGVSVKQLRQWNNLDSNQLKTGQRLIVSK